MSPQSSIHADVQHIRAVGDMLRIKGLLAKIFHEMPDGELGVSWCGDFDYSRDQAEFFAACGEFPYSPDSDIAIRCLDNGAYTSPSTLDRAREERRGWGGGRGEVLTEGFV